MNLMLRPLYFGRTRASICHESGGQLSTGSGRERASVVIGRQKGWVSRRQSGRGLSSSKTGRQRANGTAGAMATRWRDGGTLVARWRHAGGVIASVTLSRARHAGSPGSPMAAAGDGHHRVNIAPPPYRHTVPPSRHQRLTRSPPSRPRGKEARRRRRDTCKRALHPARGRARAAPAGLHCRHRIERRRAAAPAAPAAPARRCARAARARRHKVADVEPHLLQLVQLVQLLRLLLLLQGLSKVAAVRRQAPQHISASLALTLKIPNSSNLPFSSKGGKALVCSAGVPVRRASSSSTP
jgi:hypothetical protein